MQVLTLRFANLNSLLGEWQIDFTDPAYLDDGLFAITGPTGAGKSSILDALCLALFGRTPRLERINKSGNELMSRQAGDCFAEVRFRSGRGEFRCHWQQHRARRRRDGELQAPKHEIADARSGEILATGLRDVAAAVETTTGMDYLRFTRSMLLAQGGFASFLQAAPDQRAPLLEQITGTDIYSAISMGVHERRNAERSRLQERQAALDALETLSPEEEARLREQLLRDEAAERRLAAELRRQRECIAWCEGLEQLEEQRLLAERAARDLELERDSFAAQLERLAAAQRALELDADFAALETQRQTEARDQSRLTGARERLPQLETASRNAQDREREAQTQRDLARTRRLEQQPLLREVRALDQQIAAQRERRSTLTTALDGDARALESLREDAAESRRRLAGCDESRQSLLLQRQTDGVDAALVDSLGILQQQAVSLAEAAEERRRCDAEQRDAEERLTQAREARETQARDLSALQRALSDADEILRWRQGARDALLAGEDAGGWRRRQEQLAHEQRRAIRLAEVLEDYRQQCGRARHLAARGQELRDGLHSLEPAIATQRQALGEADERLALLEDQNLLLQRIESLEAERQHLVDGQPCPLCGATAHPYQEAALPRRDDTQRELQRRREERAAMQEALDVQRQRHASLQAQLGEVDSAGTEQATTLQKARRLAETLLAESGDGAAVEGPALEDPALDESLERKRCLLAEELEQIAARLQRAEAIESELLSRKRQREELRDQLSRAQLELVDREHRETHAQSAVKQCLESRRERQRREEGILGELRRRLSDFGGAGVHVEDMAAFLETLRERRERWLRGEERLRKLEQERGELLATQRNQAEQRKRRMEEQRARQVDLAALTEAMQEREARRSELLGSRKADEEAARLDTAVDDAEEALTGAQRSVADSALALGEVRTQIAELEPGLRALKQDLEAGRQRFAQRLARLGFADPAAYRAARMDARERAQLTERRDDLARRGSAIEAQRQQLVLRLREEQERALTEQPLDQLRDALGDQTDEQGRLQQALGALRQRLEDNRRAQDLQRESRDALQAQQRECRRWDDLHALIGSADGKKYRNFAQGLTFELMVGHANQQLQRMSDRYLLLHDPERPLELSVIDDYQGGELRSTRNLSGGESFIVSLALALGLSGMASRRLRVDSLFLDEGFGTLDEDALDTALETLASLQRDGKSIGVISHVPMLKERIGNQIRVSPLSGGRSELSGPGCSRRTAQ